MWSSSPPLKNFGKNEGTNKGGSRQIKTWLFKIPFERIKNPNKDVAYKPLRREFEILETCIYLAFDDIKTFCRHIGLRHTVLYFTCSKNEFTNT